jgi:hypothetical protein
MEWKIVAEDSAKKAKDTFSVCNDSVGCRCYLSSGNPEVRE